MEHPHLPYFPVYGDRHMSASTQLDQSHSNSGPSQLATLHSYYARTEHPTSRSHYLPSIFLHTGLLTTLPVVSI